MSRIKSKIKKGDRVTIITGRDKGKEGEVTKVLLSDNRVFVQGINMVTKHKKATQESAGGIEKIEASIHASNVALIDPKEKKATRAGYKLAKDGTKTRIARKSGQVV